MSELQQISAAREGLSSEQRAQSRDTDSVDSSIKKTKNVNPVTLQYSLPVDYKSIDQLTARSQVTSHDVNLLNNQSVQEPPQSSEDNQSRIAGTLVMSKSGDKLANGIIAQVSSKQIDQGVANSCRLETIVTRTQVDKSLDKKESSGEVAGASSLPRVSSDEDSTAGELVEGPAAERPSDQPYQHVSEIEKIAYGVQLTDETSYEIVTSKIVIPCSGQGFHHCFDDYDRSGSLHQPLSDNSPLPFTYMFPDIPP